MSELLLASLLQLCNYVPFKSFHVVAPHTRTPPPIPSPSSDFTSYVMFVGTKATLRINPQRDEESRMWPTEMLLSWHQGLWGMSQSPRAVTCLVPVSLPAGRHFNGQTDRVRLWCQYGSWLSVVIYGLIVHTHRFGMGRKDTCCSFDHFWSVVLSYFSPLTLLNKSYVYSESLFSQVAYGNLAVLLKLIYLQRP